MTVCQMACMVDFAVLYVESFLILGPLTTKIRNDSKNKTESTMHAIW